MSIMPSSIVIANARLNESKRSPFNKHLNWFSSKLKKKFDKLLLPFAIGINFLAKVDRTKIYRVFHFYPSNIKIHTERERKKEKLKPSENEIGFHKCHVVELYV